MSVFPDIKTIDDKIDEEIIQSKVQTLKSYKIGSHEFLVNPTLGYYPYFSMELRARVKALKIINCVCTGEGGVSKSYTVADIWWYSAAYHPSI